MAQSREMFPFIMLIPWKQVYNILSESVFNILILKCLWKWLYQKDNWFFMVIHRNVL